MGPQVIHWLYSKVEFNIRTLKGVVKKLLNIIGMQQIERKYVQVILLENNIYYYFVIDDYFSAEEVLIV